LPFVVAAASFAQHGYTPSRMERGRFLYRTDCAPCHGPDGDSPIRIGINVT
jgi:cytochrome c